MSQAADDVRADIRATLVGTHCTSPDGTMIHAPTDKIIEIVFFYYGRAIASERIRVMNQRGAAAAEPPP